MSGKPTVPIGVDESKDCEVLKCCTVYEFEPSTRLGAGDFGSVLLVHCKNTKLANPGKLYALKVMYNYAGLTTKGVRSTFEVEFLQYQKFPPHPNIVRCWHCFTNPIPIAVSCLIPQPAWEEMLKATGDVSGRSMPTTMYGVFDYYPRNATSLRDKAAPITVDGVTYMILPPLRFRQAADDVLSGLRHLEAHNILHRDIKPDNVLIAEDGRLCVCDLGESLSIQDGNKVVILPRDSPGGNHLHAAPEVIDVVLAFARDPLLMSSAVDYTGQAVFEAGVLLWELATGQHPIVGGYPLSFRDPLLPGPVRYSSDVLMANVSVKAMQQAGYPHGFVELLQSMIVCDASQRPTLTQAHERLLELFSKATALAQLKAVKLDGHTTPELVGWVVGTMTMHLDSARIQEQGCYLLWNIALDAESQGIIVREGGLACVLAAMDRHGEVASVQVCGCWVLRNLAVNADNQATIVSQDGLTRIFTVMDRHVNVGIVQEVACMALCNVAANAGNKLRIVDEGGLTHIFTAMDRHADVAGVQEHALAVLRSLALNSENQVRIVVEGGLTRIFTAMNRHVDVASVQEQACALLWNVACNDSNKLRIVSDGGLARIFAALDRHVDVVGVQEKACGVLRSLALSAGNQTRIVDEGGVLRVLTAMRLHVGAVNVQANCCSMLCNVAGNIHPGIHTKIFSEGGVACVLAAMDQCYDAPSVQEAACGALRNLAIRADGQVRIIGEGGLARIRTAIGRHVDNVGVQEHACAALRNLSCSTDAVVLQALRDGACIALVQGVAPTHSANPTIRQHLEVITRRLTRIK